MDDLNNSKKKREEKIRRRDNKAPENVFKNINALPVPDRFDALVTKYKELYEDYRTCGTSLSTAEKNIITLHRLRDQLQSEQSKQVLARSRMENLCRELQRQNKIIKEENLIKIREEEEKRKEVAAKFQVKLNEFTKEMQENTEKNNKLRDDNFEMATKFKSLYEQLEKREELRSKMNHQVELELQLTQAQREKVQLELKSEQSVWAHEKQALEEKCRKSEETCLQLQNTVKALQDNLELYSGKYQEFKSSISKSNQVFDDCKSEMGKMAKTIVFLEKEVKTWKNRSEKNAQLVLELTANKQAHDSKLEASDRKVDQLQKLCRQLQVDRSSYLQLLKSNGIEAVSQVCVDENITPKPINKPVKQKMTNKEKHLEQLKNNLQVLQDQLSTIHIQNAADETSELPLSKCDVPRDVSEIVCDQDNKSLESLIDSSTSSSL